MSTLTGKDLNLVKPELTDDYKVTIGTDLPANFQKIDDEFSTHKADTATAHGATSEVTANKIMLRDVNGRVKAGAGYYKDEVITLVDVVYGTYTTGQTEVSNIALRNSQVYMLITNTAIHAYSNTFGMYLVCTKFLGDNVLKNIQPIFADVSVEVSIDDDHKVNVKNTSGGARVVSFKLIMVG